MIAFCARHMAVDRFRLNEPAHVLLAQLIIVMLLVVFTSALFNVDPKSIKIGFLVKFNAMIMFILCLPDSNYFYKKLFISFLIKTAV